MAEARRVADRAIGLSPRAASCKSALSLRGSAFADEPSERQANVASFSCKRITHNAARKWEAVQALVSCKLAFACGAPRVCSSALSVCAHDMVQREPVVSTAVRRAAVSAT
jgi:hypothetical protein